MRTILRAIREQIPNAQARRKILRGGPLNALLVLRERSGEYRLELDSCEVLRRLMGA
jgi:hypothetical protein